MNETALTWIVFILAFGGMVIVHELGHFVAARLVKVEVEEFGIGFPTPGAVTFWISAGYFFLRNGKRVEVPRNFSMPVSWNELVNHEVKLTVREENGRFILQSLEAVLVEKTSSASEKEAFIKRPVRAGKDRGGTEWIDVISEVHPGTRFTLNWLPLGGFVRPKGENDPQIAGGLAAASPWKRLFVLSAGPFMNLLTAVLVISLIIHQLGGFIVSPSNSNAPQQIFITEVIEGSPADQGGIQVGDILLAANGEPLTVPERLREIIQASAGAPILFQVRRGGETLTLSVTPRVEPASGEPRIGIGYCPGCEFKPITSLAETLSVSLQIAVAQIHTLATLPIRLVRGTIAPQEGRIIGLKGIFDIMSQSVSSDLEAAQTAPPASAAAPNPNAPVQTLSIIAMLSLSLGIFNLFPFPALDGGRIFFVLPEIVLGRRIPHQFENLVHGIGMTLLIILMIYVNVRDFVDPVFP